MSVIPEYIRKNKTNSESVVSDLIKVMCLTGGDSLEYHNNQAFATKDNDVMKHGCPQLRHGAWWYVHCSYSNLNGPYTVGQGTDGSTMSWYHWRKYYSLKQTKMMIMKV